MARRGFSLISLLVGLAFLLLLAGFFFFGLRSAGSSRDKVFKTVPVPTPFKFATPTPTPKPE